MLPWKISARPPSYGGHICKRINKSKVDFINSVKAVDGNDDLIIAIDSTGIEVNGWMTNGTSKTKRRVF